MAQTIHRQPLESWEEILQACTYLVRSRDFVFRGQQRASWDLKTSIEREFGPRSPAELSEFPSDELIVAELKMLQHFIRHAPRQASQPDDDDRAAWLGLLQHYGGVTRLLDVSVSPWVALFVAFEALGDDEDRAVWAIDTTWCQRSVASSIAKTNVQGLEQVLQLVHFNQRGLLDATLTQDALASRGVQKRNWGGAFALAPWKPDNRQVAQQARFLCPVTLSMPFMMNLAALEPAAYGSLPTVWKFLIPATLRAEVLHQLALMGVSAATLFPGVDGAARATRTLPLRAPRVSIDDTPQWAMVNADGTRITKVERVGE